MVEETDQKTAERKNPRYKFYTLRSPRVDHPDKVQKAAEQKLINDLHDLDDDGWEIAFFFPSGTHVLMMRKVDWKPKDDKPVKETGK